MLPGILMVLGPALIFALRTATRREQSPPPPTQLRFRLPPLRIWSVTLLTVSVTSTARGTREADEWLALRIIRSRSPLIFCGIASTASGALSTLKETGTRVEVGALLLGACNPWLTPSSIRT